MNNTVIHDLDGRFIASDPVAPGITLLKIISNHKIFIFVRDWLTKRYL